MHREETKEKGLRLLDQAKKLLEQEHNLQSVLTDWIEEQDIEGYGYVEELKEEIEELKEELKRYEVIGAEQDIIPKIRYLDERNKFEFFCQNFDKISSEDLERIAKDLNWTILPPRNRCPSHE